MVGPNGAANRYTTTGPGIYDPLFREKQLRLRSSRRDCVCFDRFHGRHGVSLSREHVAFGTMPDRMVPCTFDIEAISEHQRSTVGSPHRNEQSGCDAENEHGCGGTGQCMVSEPSQSKIYEDNGGGRHHKQRVRVNGPACCVPASLDFRRSHTPVTIAPSDTNAPAINTNVAAW